MNKIFNNDFKKAEKLKKKCYSCYFYLAEFFKQIYNGLGKFTWSVSCFIQSILL